MNPQEHERETARRLNKLLRHELAAVDTYGQLLDRVRDDPFRTELNVIREQHRAACETLSNYIRARGGEPASEGAAWEAFNHLRTGGISRLLGNDGMIRILRRDEERGCRHYEHVLGDDTFDTECKMLVYQLLLPQQKRHVQLLDLILQGHGKAA